MEYLFNVALSLPLNTAWVEHIFSELALAKTNHKNRLKKNTLQYLMKLKVHSSLVDMDQLIESAALKNLSLKKRHL